MHVYIQNRQITEPYWPLYDMFICFIVRLGFSELEQNKTVLLMMISWIIFLILFVVQT